jgi:branched-chain amino acid transport system permease protein
LDVFPFLILGGVLGTIYTLLSEGFGLMYGVAGILNGSYGALYMLTDYIVFTLFQYLGFSIYAAIALSLVVIFFVGVLVQQYIVARGKSALDILFLTLAFAFVLQYAVAYLQCSSTFAAACSTPAFVPIFIGGSTTVLGVSVNNQQLAADGVSIMFLAGLWLFLSRTKFGSSIRAVSQDKAAAELVGINTGRTMLLTAGIATTMAGVSAAFLASYQTVDPTIGWNAITLAFAIVILGGLGSLKGAVVASFILAYAQTFVLLFVDPVLTQFVALSMLIVVLLVRPQGIFGKEVV